MEGAHPQSLAGKFESEEDLKNWIITFYIDRMTYFAMNMGEETVYGTKITPRLLKNTKRRYLELLIRNDNVINGEFFKFNK